MENNIKKHVERVQIILLLIVILLLFFGGCGKVNGAENLLEKETTHLSETTLPLRGQTAQAVKLFMNNFL